MEKTSFSFRMGRKKKIFPLTVFQLSISSQLLSVERLSLYSASLRVCFLLFESMREHLKFQLEVSILKYSYIIFRRDNLNTLRFGSCMCMEFCLNLSGELREIRNN